MSRLSPKLPGFGRANWMSNKRRLVTVHPTYSDMEPWSGTETSDIVYDDDRGVLTSILIERGSLSSDWQRKRPKYFIEVKATMGACATPFFISNRQYKRVGFLTNKSQGMLLRSDANGALTDAKLDQRTHFRERSNRCDLRNIQGLECGQS